MRIALGLLLAATITAAQSTPQIVRVQGHLSDTGGTAPDGTYDMTFELYDDEVLGTQVATSGAVQVQVTDGAYEHEFPVAQSAFDGSDRFLQIIVEGETLTPRIRMVNTPFAYVADRVDGLEGADLEESAEILSEIAAHDTDPTAHVHDHDAVYYTEAEVDLLVTNLQAQINAIPTWCAELEDKGVVNVRCHGAIPDDGLDDTAAFQAALAAGGHLKVVIPSGEYLITQTLFIQGRVVEGAGTTCCTHWTRIKVKDDASGLDAVMTVDGSQARLSGVTLNANARAKYALFLDNGSQSRLDDIIASQANEAGFYVFASEITVGRDLTAQNNFGDGFWIRDANGSRFTGINAMDNDHYGIVVSATGTTSGGVTLSGHHIARNGPQPPTTSGEGGGIKVQRTTAPLLIENFYMESNGGDSVDLEGTSFATLHNLRITSREGDTAGEAWRAIRLDEWACAIPGTCDCPPPPLITADTPLCGDDLSSFANHIVANALESDTGGHELPSEKIYVHTGSHSNRFVGNFDLFSVAEAVPALMEYEGAPMGEPDEPQDRNNAMTVMTARLPAPPTQGQWRRGDIVWNSDPNVGEPAGWICTTGTAGGLAWAEMGALGSVASASSEGTPFITFARGDATPSVAGGSRFKTAPGPGPITHLDDGADGQEVTVVFDGDSSVDFEAGNLRTADRCGAACTPDRFSVMRCVYDGSLWFCEF